MSEMQANEKYLMQRIIFKYVQHEDYRICYLKFIKLC